MDARSVADRLLERGGGGGARRHGLRGVRRGLPAAVLRQLAREHRQRRWPRWATCSAPSRSEPTWRPRIVVTRRIPEPALELLQRGGRRVGLAARPAAATGRAARRRRGADAVVTLLHDRVDDAFLDAAGPCLRVVANVAVGYDNVDVAACARRGVVVHATRPGVLTDATADIALALILMATRRLGEGERLIRAGSAVVVEHVLHARHRGSRERRSGSSASARSAAPRRGGRGRSGWRSPTRAGGGPTPLSRPSSTARFLRARRAARRRPTWSRSTAR